MMELPEDSSNQPPVWRYPAITACIGEARIPGRDEIRIVATRLWCEGLAFRPDSPVATFGIRRRLIGAAITTLSGSHLR